MLRFYSTQISDTEIVLDENDSRHAIKALRLTHGAQLEIVDGLGTIYTAEIESPNHKKCICSIIEAHKEKPLPYSLHVAVAPTKNIDRLEWFLEKATELGITEITPLLCSNSERKNLKTERLERILVSAMKQSLKATKPVLNPLTSLKDFLSQDLDGVKLMAHCEAGEKTLVSKLDKTENTFTILIGPEGDFTPAEIALGREIGFKALSLGNSRLRTETAALLSVASIYNRFI
jgi:16S rRNA (uracil1498-N3)-methyltransferase